MEKKVLSCLKKVFKNSKIPKDMNKIKMGNNSTIGFIAQQVKEHMPMAVSTNKEIIPNELRILKNYKWILFVMK